MTWVYYNSSSKYLELSNILYLPSSSVKIIIFNVLGKYFHTETGLWINTLPTVSYLHWNRVNICRTIIYKYENFHNYLFLHNPNKNNLLNLTLKII